MAQEHSFEEHRKTQGYLEAKERMLDKMAQWGGVIRKMPGVEENPAKRRAELQQQAREIKEKHVSTLPSSPLVAEDFKVTPENPITDNDLPASFFEDDDDSVIVPF